MKCLILTSPNSWFNNYLDQLRSAALAACPKLDIVVAHEPPEGQEPFHFCLILSYEKILKEEFLSLNEYNLIVHASDLPKGKGMSPVTWQVLEGKNKIPIRLFEATKEVDAGKIYLKSNILLNGLELVDEIREKQALETIVLVKSFFEKFPEIGGTPQQGEETCYRKRTPEDGRLDVDRTIRDQFNLLRISDNRNYPAFFEIEGEKYKLEIRKINKRGETNAD